MHHREAKAIEEERDRLREMTSCTMGVGAGDGKLFVHGDYESIKAAQDIVLEKDRLKVELEIKEAEKAQKQLCIDDLKRQLVEQENKLAKMRKTLQELYTLVKGECPSLLNEDSGGNANLDMAIEEVLKEATND